MNIEAMERLAEWLEAGAPHAVFNMNYGLLNHDHDPDLYYDASASSEDCGTVCCIAGAAVFLSGKTELEEDEDHWDDIKPRALKILGLPENPLNYMGHDLFDPTLAPEDCTPRQAAEAVRRMLAGKEPWE